MSSGSEVVFQVVEDFAVDEAFEASECVFLERPSLSLRCMYSMVRASSLSLTIAIMWSARLAFCRHSLGGVASGGSFPEDTGTGAAPQSLAKAASFGNLSMFSPVVIGS